MFDKPIFAREKMEALGKEVIGPLVNGADICRFVVGLPFGGRSTVIKHIVYYPENISKGLADLVDKVIWIVVDLPVEKTLKEELSGSRSFLTKYRAEDIADGDFGDIIRFLVKEKNEKVGIVVNSLDSADNERRRQIFAQILQMYYEFPGEIKLVFGQGCEEVEWAKNILRDLYPYYSEKRGWIGMMEKDDLKLLYPDVEGEFLDSVFKFSGGYLPLVKRFTEKQELVKDINVAVQDSGVDYLLGVLWGSCSEDTQDQLLLSVRGEKDNFSDYATKTGLITGDGDVFSAVFREWLVKMSAEKGLEVIEKDGMLWSGKQDLLEKLSGQEYAVLNCLWKSKGELVERQKMAEVMWGDEADSKYSDWAIDQVISKIRRKLGDVGKERKIATVKGKGFVLRA